MPIALELLPGGARLRGLEHPLEPERKTAALLAYLALEGATPRSRLAGLLWPDGDERRARTNLRQALHRLGPYRRALTDGDPLGLREDVVVDALAAEPDGPADGELLERYEYDDCPELQAWLDAERESRRASLLDRLAAAADRLEAEGELRKAAQRARRAAELEPLSEEAARRLVRLLALSGDRGAALVAYARFRARLARELGLEPSPESERLAELVRSGGLPGRPPRLPRPATPFVGRAAELRAATGALAAGARLLTFSGPAGVGKSRLALAVAERVAAGFPDGVAFLAVAELGTRTQLVAGLAAAVGLRAGDPRELEARLLHRLRTERRLLLVDGVDALPEALPLLAALGGSAPDVVLLATSRGPTGLPGERVVEVAGMRPDGDALALFEAAAARARSGAPLDEEERPSAREVCELLEGSPLGIELAAAWLASRSCGELARELRDGEAPLAGLGAVFARSWELLGEDERRALLALGTFRGGFDPAAARAVAGAGPRLLDALASRSLLAPAGGGRFGLHALVRHDLASRLAQRGEEEARLRTRHARHFLARLTAAGARLEGAERGEALARLEPDLPNLRDAWRHAAGQRDVEALAAAAGPLALLFEATGRQREGLDLLTHAAARLHAGSGDAERRALGRILVQSAWLGHQLGLPSAEGDARRGLELLRPLGDTGGVRQGLFALGALAWYRGDPAEARASWREAHELARADGDAVRAVRALANLGMFEDALGDPEAARLHYLEALELSERLGDGEGSATVLNNLGQLLVDAGRPEEAVPLLRRGLAHLRGGAAPPALPYLLDTLANALLRLGRSEEAEAALEEALRHARGSGDQRMESEALLTRLRLAQAAGDAPEAEARALAALAAAWRGGYRAALRSALLALGELRAARGDAAGAAPALRLVAAEAEAPERARAEALLEALGPVPPGETPPAAQLVVGLLGDAVGDAPAGHAPVTREEASWGCAPDEGAQEERSSWRRS